MENGMINYKTFLALIDEIGNLQEKVIELEQCLEITRAAAKRSEVELREQRAWISNMPNSVLK